MYRNRTETTPTAKNTDSYCSKHTVAIRRKDTSQVNQGKVKEQFNVTWNKTLVKSFSEGGGGTEKDKEENSQQQQE